MSTQTMTKNRYQKRMSQHAETFDKLWQKIVSDTNDFKRDNPDIGMYTMQQVKGFESFIDHLCLSGSWIHDRINGYIATTHNSDYKKTLTKKIRKALGLTL